MADVILVAKTNSASSADIGRTIQGARRVNPAAKLVRCASLVTLDDPAAVRGRQVLVIEDGPTLTHGGMAYGAGYVAAVEAGASGFVDPRASAAGEIAGVYARYPHIGPVLPAVGYSAAQLQALEETIAGSTAEVVVIATPCDLAALIRIGKPVVRARYEFAEAGEPTLASVVEAFLDRTRLP
jgi:predicted GTPase